MVAGASCRHTHSGRDQGRMQELGKLSISCGSPGCWHAHAHAADSCHGYTAVEAGDEGQAVRIEMHSKRGELQVSTEVQVSGRRQGLLKPSSCWLLVHSSMAAHSDPAMHIAVKAGDNEARGMQVHSWRG